MKNMKNHFSSLAITLAAILLFTVTCIFQCPKTEAGTYMNCHKANVAVAVISGVLIVLGIFLCVLKNKLARRILFGISACVSVVCAIVPGIVISLCMMPGMTCRSIMRPLDLIFSFLIFLFSGVGFLLEEKLSERWNGRKDRTKETVKP
jgi:hypothetical protein